VTGADQHRQRRLADGDAGARPQRPREQRDDPTGAAQRERRARHERAHGQQPLDRHPPHEPRHQRRERAEAQHGQRGQHAGGGRRQAEVGANRVQERREAGDRRAQVQPEQDDRDEDPAQGERSVSWRSACEGVRRRRQARTQPCRNAPGISRGEDTAWR
jgi:hypothetical protein